MCVCVWGGGGGGRGEEGEERRRNQREIAATRTREMGKLTLSKKNNELPLSTYLNIYIYNWVFDELYED